MTLRTVKGIVKYSIASSCLVFAFGCGGEHVEEVEEVFEYDSDSTLREGYEEELVNIRSSIQESSHLYQMISEAGFGYDNGMLNPASKASSYSTNKQKALGLGVYCSDVSYSTV